MINKTQFEADLMKLLKKYKIKTDDLIELRIEIEIGNNLIIIPTYVGADE